MTPFSMLYSTHSSAESSTTPISRTDQLTSYDPDNQWLSRVNGEEPLSKSKINKSFDRKEKILIINSGTIPTGMVLSKERLLEGFVRFGGRV